MKNYLGRSLPAQALASVFAIAILCFISAVGSGVLAWVSQADGQAINTAGSIRMATYRIKFQIATDFDRLYSADLDSNPKTNPAQTDSTSYSDASAFLITDMENRLASLRQYQRHYGNEHDSINDQLAKIETQWFNGLKPALLSRDKASLYSASDSYVKDADGLVDALQYRNEQRQMWQQLLQIASLVLTLIIMLVGFAKLQQNVLLPVQRLITANSQFRQGKRDTRVSISGYKEFKKLGDSFNDMARTIETSQQSLENEVQIKTRHLIKANQALSLFYDFSKQLTISPVSLHKLDSLITDFGHIFSHLDITLCIQSNILSDKDSIALHDDRMKELCTKLTCDNCIIKDNSHTQTFPIVHQDVEFGELNVRPKSVLLSNDAFLTDNANTNANVDINTNANANQESSSSRIKMVDIDSAYLDARSHELIVALTNLISTALSLRKQKQQEHQLILLEERSTIARELHDSLAQSLSYLKIQVSVLEKHLKKYSDKDDQHPFDEQNQAKVWQHISQIKTGLNSAYQELRDLLTTFRLSIDSANFDEALYEAADEFAVKGDFAVKVNNQIMSLNLSAAEQVHLIQIIREALSNVSRHAQAKNVTIDLGYDDESNYIALAVIDDGIGMSGTVNQTQHHGLMIMKERAYKLGGDLIVTANEPTGVSVIVRFVPHFFTDYMTETTDFNESF
ncbi:histidine kinase [Psychrobacter sp. 1U1]|uniref:histidine kinase n=2 Tax=unclassified Psychrobacter TaxID=196806 RepID=UPI003F483215